MAVRVASFYFVVHEEIGFDGTMMTGREDFACTNQILCIT